MPFLLWAELAAYALGTVGAALVFLEFFQTPAYVVYNRDQDRYRVSMVNQEADEYTTLGRVGAFLLAVAFATLFVVRILAA